MADSIPPIKPAHLPRDGSAPRPRFFFVDEAAIELRRSVASCRWMIHTGQLKAGKIGGRTVIAASEIDRIINAAFAEAS